MLLDIVRRLLAVVVSFAACCHAGRCEPPSAARLPKNESELAIAQPELLDRPLPLKELTVEQTLDVTDFGAIPNDSENDLPAVRRAIEKARNDKIPTQIAFPPGRYVFDADFDTDVIAKGLKTSLVLFQMENVVFNGNGAEITIRKPRLGFLKVLGCRNVIVKNFEVDWDPPPFAQGFIRRVDVDRRTFDFEEQPGFLSLDHPNWQLEANKNIGPSRWGVILDRNVPGRLKTDAQNVVFYEGWEKNADGTYRITVRNVRALEDMEPGDRYVQVDRNGGGLVSMRLSERVTCMNLTNYTSPGLDYGGSECSEVAVLGCRVLLRPGRWHTSNADGVHLQKNRIGPWIENCTFEGLTDDGVNLYTKAATCLEVLSPRRFRLTKQTGWRPGDGLLVYNPREGERVGEARIETVKEDRGTMTITTDADLVAIQTGSDKTADSFFNLDLNTSSFVIRNNTFRNIRRFGILVQSRDGIIENNRFEATSSLGIMVHNDADWPEGFATGNLIIRGNTFRGCGFDHTMRLYHAAAIGLSVEKLGWQPAQWRGLSRLLIEDNTIINWRRQGICLGCAEDVIIRGNRFLVEGDPPPPIDDRPFVPIRVFNARRVLVTGNVISDPREIPAGGVVVDSSSEEIVVRENRIEE